MLCTHLDLGYSQAMFAVMASEFCTDLGVPAQYVIFLSVDRFVQCLFAKFNLR